MARTIDDYLDAAIARLGCKSDRDLGRQIGLRSPVVCFWRTRRAWPADQSMILLADAAGISREQALLDLCAWRSDGAASSVYRQIAERIALAATAAAGFIVAAVKIGMNSVFADTIIASAQILNRATEVTAGMIIMSNSHKRI